MALDLDTLYDGVTAGVRGQVSRAITLVESRRPDHRAMARDLLARLAENASGEPAVRVGISSVPGVGKSTFIEGLGTHLTAQGFKVGVLAVDPSSVRTGGSVLGDKTRMPRLSVDPNAFIRPRRRPAPSVASPPRPRRRWACSRGPGTTWCWWRPSASASRRSPSPAWSTPSSS
nr:hypothetical protein [Nocardioides daphniae]